MADDLGCRNWSLGSRPGGYITARIRPQWECERGNFAPAVDLAHKSLSAGKLRQRTSIVASRRKPRPTAHLRHSGPGRMKRLVRWGTAPDCASHRSKRWSALHCPGIAPSTPKRNPIGPLWCSGWADLAALFHPAGLEDLVPCL